MDSFEDNMAKDLFDKMVENNSDSGNEFGSCCSEEIISRKSKEHKTPQKKDKIANQKEPILSPLRLNLEKSPESCVKENDKEEKSFDDIVNGTALEPFATTSVAAVDDEDEVVTSKRKSKIKLFESDNEEEEEIESKMVKNISSGSSIEDSKLGIRMTRSNKKKESMKNRKKNDTIELDDDDKEEKLDEMDSDFESVVKSSKKRKITNF